MLSSYLATCLVACFVASIAGNEAIVNGYKAKVDQFPYQVSLQGQLIRHFCGGGIIAEQFILTAAHCVLTIDGDFDGSRIFVLIGSNDLHVTAPPAMTVEVKYVYVTREYKPHLMKVTGDIAVLKLEVPLKFSQHVRKMELPQHKYEYYSGKTALIAGFGLHWVLMNEGIKKNGSRLDTGLRFNDATVLKNRQCSEDVRHMSYEETISEKQICARLKQPNHMKSYGVCYGDSGGPLVIDGKVIGILSRSSADCEEQVYPAVYTRVSYYLNFIENAMVGKLTRDMRMRKLIH